MGNKATKATVAQRVEEILAMRLAGAGRVEIFRNASERGWGVCERQVETYIQRSDELLAQSLEHDRPKLLALHQAQRRLLLNKALEVGDYRTALAVLQDSAKLLDLYPASKATLQHTGPGGGPIQTENLTDDDIAARIAELESRVPRTP
jgi:hypothetical protein